MSADDYTNPEVKDELDEKRRRLQQYEEQQLVEEAAEVESTRQMLASEEQPDPESDSDAPDLRETYEVEFRGHAFEFYELGDTAVEAAQYAGVDEGDLEAGSEAASFIYRVIGEKCVNDSCGVSYWRQYDFDDVMDLFFELVEESSDIDQEEIEDIEEFRDE